MLVAGEASGDALGASLMAGLRQRSPLPVRFSGIGGELMTAAGLDSLFPMRELSVMGLAEVLPRLPRLLGRIGETVAMARSGRPDALVTIDAPSFGLRVGAKLRGEGIPRIHYVAPQLWAWRPGRARRLGEKTDCLLALLPFEPEFFRRFDIDCRFVGHPAVERMIATATDQPKDKAHFGLGAEQPTLLMLPGSRQGEITRLLPVFQAVVARLRRRWPDLAVLLPTVENVAAEVRRSVADWPSPPLVVQDGADRMAAFGAADFALAASGTVTLELALSGTPMVVAYRANPLTAALVRRLIKVDHVAIPNILLGGGVVPEFIQEHCQPEPIAEALAHLLDDPSARAEQCEQLAQMARMLGSDGEPPSLRAARAVLEVIESRSAD